ncbi:hypothetical protein [Clostridium sp. M62/1]|uniref:hypothetical protein n=1 Tax=Clostridium sp. M62/1 TaxID=411486 RepID=UPI0015B61DA1
MGRIKLFENWAFNRNLPEPFAQEIGKRGKKYTTEFECLSRHNHMFKGKRATLHAATLQGIMHAVNILTGKENGAFGVQIQNGDVKQCYLEHERAKNGVSETHLLVYEPASGAWNGMVASGSTLTHYPQIGERGASGSELFTMLLFASITPEIRYDSECEDGFSQFRQQMEQGYPDMEKAMCAAFILCDNFYRRIENAETLKGQGLVFDGGCLQAGNLPFITTAKLKNGEYALTKTYYGNFCVFQEKRIKERPTIRDIAGKYKRNHPLTKAEEALVPALPENYEVSQETLEIVEAVCQTPMRVFMMAGEAGTGKTTSAKIAAQLLGLPYYFFTCGEATDEVDLVSSMIPNTGRREPAVPAVFPSFQDMKMDPATALERVTGIYEEETKEEEAFQRILKTLYEQGYQCGQKEKDYVLVESSIVTGCRRPSLIEIQEPSVISKPGTLVKLNGLLDDGAAITLTNGEIVHRNPDTVIILTTNMDYRGCKGFNESVLSRMRMILYSEPLTPEEMVARVQKRVGNANQALLEKMAKTVCEIQKYCHNEMIAGGVCGYREYEDWVWAYLIQKDVCKAALHTVIAKASPNKEEREEIYKTQILTKFQEKNETPVVQAA